MSLRPIDRITQTAQTIGDKRDFTRRVDYVGPQDEVGRLANTFNQMLSSLQNAYQKVEHSLKMQRDFVADVSHELRTPLTTLRGNLGLLGRDLPLVERDDIVTDMVEESDRLICLVNDLLLLARADAGRNLAKEPFQILPVVDEITRQINLLAPQRQINSTISDHLEIIGDRDAFKQVMLILLDNAIQHSDGVVDVHAQQKDAQIEISVRDYGAGMDEETLAHIFDRFYRGEDRTNIPGFGLGLPIAKKLIESMGGKIDIESKIGSGSAVKIKLTQANSMEAD